ncbi:MAG: endonuclease/exonuclease/phosphatase family protein [Phycisphaerales bacterium]|nr:endonuclease/exonuclease/phosphatase family protein [Phycisphaerales bacterium]
MLTLLTWNILHGGGSRRTPQIVLSLLEFAPDVMVITEYRAAMGGQVRGVLADHGWEHQVVTDAGAKRNGILVAGRTPLRRSEAPAPPSALGPKWLEVEAPVLGLGLAAAHIPEVREGTRKVASWEFAMERCRANVGRPFVLIGDLNTGRTGQDEETPMLTCSAFMGRLWTMGFRDAWRELHPEGREYSWYSHLGHGFRIDHVLLSPALAPALREAFYGHGVRESRQSDHSALVVRLETGPGARADGGETEAAERGESAPDDVENSLF